MRVPPTVFVADARAILKGLLLADGEHGWLLAHCRHGHCRPISVPAIVRRVAAVLRDPAFQLSTADRLELLGEFLHRVEVLPWHEAKQRANIFLDERILLPICGEGDDPSCLTPEIYKGAIGLEEEGDVDVSG